jgi:hypothetical protein
MFEGLHEFHALLEPSGLAVPDDLAGAPEVIEATLGADIDYYHGWANTENGWSVFMDTLDCRPKVATDTECTAALMRYEHERGLSWAA